MSITDVYSTLGGMLCFYRMTLYNNICSSGPFFSCVTPVWATVSQINSLGSVQAHKPQVAQILLLQSPSMLPHIHVHTYKMEILENFYVILYCFQMCYLVLHSTIQHQMRVVTVREQFVLTNNVPADLLLRCYTLSLTDEKVCTVVYLL